MNKRLANLKTRKEAGFDYVISKLEIFTPLGKKALKEQRPFFPGEESLLNEELNRVEALVEFATEEPGLLAHLKDRVFMDMKDISHTIERSRDNALSVVELFELKNLLLQMEQLEQICGKTKVKLPEEFTLEPTKQLLDLLDPRKDRMATFYLYEEFSPALGRIRGEKRKLEISLRQVQKLRRDEISRTYGVRLTPKFECKASKSDLEQMEKYSNIPDLEIIDQDYMSITFGLCPTLETDSIIREMEELQGRLEEEEEAVRKRLSLEAWKTSTVLLLNCKKIGQLDYTLAKALLAIRYDCCKPEIDMEHTLSFTDGRHIQAEDILKAKGKKYTPISVQIRSGVTCITGANMGGKTVSLKLVGLVSLLTQYGYFLPCKDGKVGLSNYTQMLIGDSQSMERGLSSFGSEMEELKEILDNSKDRSLILIDEIAGGTNPHEGLALTLSLIDYLKKRQYITLITTHFDVGGAEDKVRNLQVVGLAKADFNSLNKELKYANRKTRIEIIGRYMDYRLVEAGTDQIPKDALNIAKMLGIGDEIIDNAKKYLRDSI